MVASRRRVARQRSMVEPYWRLETDHQAGSTHIWRQVTLGQNWVPDTIHRPDTRRLAARFYLVSLQPGKVETLGRL